MNTRNVRILNRTVPLLPLIAALVIGSVIVGYAANGFLTLIKHPVQQETYVRTEEIIIGDVVDFLWASVTLEGETNEAGEFVLGKPLSVSLLIRSLRPDFLVTDDYTVMIGGETVLYGTFTNLEMGTDYTDTGTWTPSKLGSAVVALDIIDMLWTEMFWVTFTDLTVEIEPHPDPLIALTFVGNTLPIGTPIREGSLVDFDYTLYNDVPIDGANPRGWLYDIDVSTDAGVTWTTVGTGKVWGNGDAYLDPPPTTQETFEADFMAPSIDGGCKVRLRLYDIRGNGEGEPGT